MKALVLKEINKPLELDECSCGKLEDDRVIVKLAASAINHRDLWIKKGLYAGIKCPIVLGSDGAGVVIQASENANQWLTQKVIINPSLSWGSKESSQAKEFKILGLPDNGTFSEEILISAKQLHKMPEHLSFEQAAALPLAGLTAFRALFSRARAIKGETVFINGIGGGVALFAMQFAIAAGCKVFVSSSSDEKIKQAIKLGAVNGVNYTTENWVKELQEMSSGIDVIIDGACGEGFKNLVEAVNMGGRIAFYGATKGTITSLDPRRVFWKQISILGTTMGSDTDFANMLDFVNTHKIIPIVDSVFSLKAANEAFDRMENGTQMGKIVFNHNI